jgi:hypothetical protein
MSPRGAALVLAILFCASALPARARPDDPTGADAPAGSQRLWLRPDDSAGLGLAWSRLNRDILGERSELMLQAYHQAHVVGPIYLQPALSAIRDPGAIADGGTAWAGSLQLTALF